MVFQRPAEQKFHRHIINLLCALFEPFALKIQTFVGEYVSYSHTYSSVKLSFACILNRATEVGLTLERDHFFKFFVVHLFSPCKIVDFDAVLSAPKGLSKRILKFSY